MRKFILAGLAFVTFNVFAQDPVVTSPFELFGDHIFIELSVDDSEPVDFIFDTGDGIAVLDVDIAQQLGLDLQHHVTRTSAQGSIDGSLIEHNKIEIGNVKLEDIELYSTNLNHLERVIGRNIDGIIGYDLLKNYVVELDYDKMAFRLYNPSSFRYTGIGQGFKFHLNSYIPHITAEVELNNGEQYKEEFFINTGAGTTMDFNTVFADKHDVIDKTGEHYSYPVAGIEDEEVLHYEGRVQNLHFGTLDFRQLPIGISQAESGIQHHKKVAGIIGNALLKHFNAVFDYSKHTVYLEPNGHFSDPYLVNASGLNLQLNESLDKILIHRVFENSPASRADLKVDAEIVRVNGEEAQEFTLPMLRKLLKSEEEVKLEVRQDNETKEVTLDLKPLI